MAQNIIKFGDWTDTLESSWVNWIRTPPTKESFTATAMIKLDDAILGYSFGTSELLYDHRIESLNDELKVLKKQIAELTSIVEKKPEEIVIRDITYKQAKKEIIKYFSDHHGGNIDAADIQKSLYIDISLALEICDELENEGKIKVV